MTAKPLNPLLNFELKFNDHPSVDINQLKRVFTEGEFKVEPIAQKAESVTFLVAGTGGISEGVSIHVEVARYGEEKELVLAGYSTVISHVSWEEYYIVEDQKVIDDDFANDATEDLFKRLDIFSQAEKLI